MQATTQMPAIGQFVALYYWGSTLWSATLLWHDGGLRKYQHTDNVCGEMDCWVRVEPTDYTRYNAVYVISDKE